MLHAERQQCLNLGLGLGLWLGFRVSDRVTCYTQSDGRKLCYRIVVYMTSKNSDNRQATRFDKGIAPLYSTSSS